MMNGGMIDSMMGGVMGLGWVLAIVAVFLVVTAVVLLMRVKAPGETAGPGGVSNIILTVLAAIGGIALVAVLAMGTMHFGMRCC
jgi:hypothetical protein